MSKVHILPEEVIAKIAAGEVIERPASVVKELLENSLDAGSTSIELHLKNAGKTSIRIKDNGHGIEQEDLERIFARHATSKINSSDDLFDIHSLGFRGEALYSVASIADINLQSKTKEQDSAWQIHMRGGEKLDFKPSAFDGSGTEIEVKELFFNTPARKKFLKTDTTELNQILNIFVPHTLLYNKCRFHLTHQDKKLFDLAPTDSKIDRIAESLHVNPKHLLEIEQDFPDHNISVHLVLGTINIVRARRDMQYIFVNGRPVENKNIAFHINNTYRLVFPPNKFPFFALFLEVPAEDVDVNIHPTKREVKIQNEKEISYILRRLCEQVLMKESDMKQAGAAQWPDESSGSKKSAPSTSGTSYSTAHWDTSLKEMPERPYTNTPTGGNEQPSTNQYTFPQESFASAGATLFERTTNEHQQATLQTKLTNARYIGSFMDKFLLYEIDQSLLMIDQHAAAERITYEHLIAQMEKSSIESQHLLTPILIKVTAQEMVTYEEVKDKLESCGFSSSTFDEETIAVHTHPMLLKDPEHCVREILAGLDTARCDFSTLARRACRSSIMAGDHLNKEKSENMRQQLIDCADPFTCPHGRPTIIEMTEDFLDKQFLRT